MSFNLNHQYSDITHAKDKEWLSLFGSRHFPRFLAQKLQRNNVSRLSFIAILDNHSFQEMDKHPAIFTFTATTTLFMSSTFLFWALLKICTGKSIKNPNYTPLKATLFNQLLYVNRLYDYQTELSFTNLECNVHLLYWFLYVN